MYASIIVPVDLAHAEGLEKALKTAADLAKHYAAPITYLGVTSALPGSVGHNPAEYQTMLETFAAGEARKYGIQSTAHIVLSHDPSVDLNAALLRAIHDSGADLVVMASHIPGIIEHLFSSHAGWIASHAKVSVMVVR